MRASSSIHRAARSADFNALVARFDSKSASNEQLAQLNRVEAELEALGVLFAAAEFNESAALDTSRMLQNFATIKNVLNVSRRRRFSRPIELSCYSCVQFDAYDYDPYSLLSLKNHSEFRSILAAFFNDYDCWLLHANWAPNRTRFVECRWERAKILYDTLLFYTTNYVEYYTNTTLRFADIELQ